MKSRSRIACLSAAAAALSFGVQIAAAADLTWDVDPLTAGVQDGDGGWDTTASTWFDGTNNVAWTNATPDSAYLGNDTNSFDGIITTHQLTLTTAVTAQNIVLGTAADGASYNIFDDFFGGSLTIAGNVTKTAPGGLLQYFGSAPITLTAGNHTFKLNDTSGNVAEFTVNTVVTGDGGVTLDNDTYQTWGTLAFNFANTYTGATNITNGRLVISTSDGLGATSAGTNIGALGTLSIGGGGLTPASGVTLTEPITITRDTYSGGEFERYTAAVVFANAGPSQTHTIAGPLVIDSTDARIQVNTNHLVISTDITEGSTVAPGTGQLTLDGDFAGFVTLSGNNTAIGTKGLKLIGGVEVNVSNDNNLGGPTAPITFAGSATLHPVGGWMTSFGTHPVNADTFSGGLNIDENQSFTVDIPLGDTVNAVGSIGKRGLGTLNLNSTINLRGGSTYWDRGTVNVNGDVTLQSLHLRSPKVNINDGAVVTLTAENSIFGEAEFGTDGGADKAVVDINGTGKLISTWGGDFFLSNQQNTEGTINLKDSGEFSHAGLLFVGRDGGGIGGKGKIVQTGGTLNLTRTGDFTLVLGSRNGTGTYELSAGTANIAGQFYVGQGTPTSIGVGEFKMTGGTMNLNNWLAIGRERGTGTVEISGNSIFNKTGGGNTSIDERSNNGQQSVMTIKDNAQYISTGGEFFVGNEGGSDGLLNVQGNASISVNNWFVVGRFGAKGTLNFSGGTITKSGGGNTEIDVDGGEASIVTMSGTGPSAAKYLAQTGDFRIGQSNGANGTVEVKESASITVSGGELWVGNRGGTGVLTVTDSGSITVGNSWIAIGRRQDNLAGSGTVTLSGNATLTRNGDNGRHNIIADGGGTVGIVNLNDSSSFTMNAGQFWVGQGGGNGTLNINGGSITGNDWMAVGRNGGSVGLVTLNSGSFTKQGSNFLVIGAGGSSATFNQSGGTLTSNNTYLAENSAATLNITGGTANFTGAFSIGHQGNNQGTLNISGGANVSVPNVIYGTNGTGTNGGAINLNGGTLTGASFTGGATSTGAKIFKFNGGLLKPAADNTNFMGAKVTGVVSTGGALIDSDGKNVTINSALTHDSALAGADGGLIKSGAGSVTLAGVNTYTGDTTVNAGTLVISGQSLGSPVMNATGGNIQLFGYNAVVKTNTINTAASTVFDVNDGKLILPRETVASATAKILAGRNGGNWDATNAIITSQSNADIAQNISTLAVAAAGAANVNKTTFGGVSVAPTDTLVMYTWNGDADLSGSVDADDYFIIDSNYGKPVTGFNNGDFDYDGVIDADDFFAIDSGFAGQTGQISPAAPAGVTAVPEPASLGMMGLAALGLMRRRRRQN